MQRKEVSIVMQHIAASHQQLIFTSCCDWVNPEQMFGNQWVVPPRAESGLCCAVAAKMLEPRPAVFCAPKQEPNPRTFQLARNREDLRRNNEDCALRSQMGSGRFPRLGVLLGSAGSDP